MDVHVFVQERIMTKYSGREDYVLLVCVYTPVMSSPATCS